MRWYLTIKIRHLIHNVKNTKKKTFFTIYLIGFIGY